MGSLPVSPTAGSELTTNPITDPHIVELDATLQRAYSGPDAFDQLMRAEGKVFRSHKNRRTIRFELEGQRYFIKIHRHAGWREVFKNASRLRLPVLTAAPEFNAIRRLIELGVPTMRCAGYARRGRNPAKLESFIITYSLDGYVTLEDLNTTWAALDEKQRRRLTRRSIREIASISRTLHTNGLNHRDFYLCHFMVRDRDWSTWTPDDELKLHVIDLHRMQIRSRTPLRWLIKDLSGLLFSIFDLNLTQRDYLRFLKVYWGREWKQRFRRTKLLRRFIALRAITLYRRKQGTLPPLPAGLSSFS